MPDVTSSTSHELPSGPNNRSPRRTLPISTTLPSAVVTRVELAYAAPGALNGISKVSFAMEQHVLVGSPDARCRLGACSDVVALERSFRRIAVWRKKTSVFVQYSVIVIETLTGIYGCGCRGPLDWSLWRFQPSGGAIHRHRRARPTSQTRQNCVLVYLLQNCKYAVGCRVLRSVDVCAPSLWPW